MMKKLARIIAGKFFISAPGPLLIVLMLCCLCSCTQNEDTNADVITIDLTSFEAVDEETLLESAIIIPLELTDESILDHSGLACCSDKGIFYYDGSTNSILYHFDNEGSFINTIGAIGQGPGEFPYHSTIKVCDEEVIFTVKQLNRLFIYDFNGKFLRSTEIPIKPIGGFAWHPGNGGYYFYTPLFEYMVFKIDSESSEIIDSIFPNPRKKSASMSPFNRTLHGSLLFFNPIDLELNIYEIDDSIRQKYIFEYGLKLGSDSSKDDNVWSTVMAEQGIWSLRVILENPEWLYICLRSQRRDDDSYTDLYHLVYHKESRKIFRLPGHLNDDTYFSFGFWLDENNRLSITISPYQIADNSFWLDAFKRNGKSFDIEDNPIVVKIPLDNFLQ